MEKNIILIGMPGCGKSTTGVILAKTLGYDFMDTDLVIQKMTGEPLQKTIDRDGLEAFLDTEERAILTVNTTKTVIATGGSAVLREKAMKHLMENGIVVYLHVDVRTLTGRLNNIKTRGIAAKAGETISDIYRLRKVYYKRYADFTVENCGSNTEKIVNEIKKAVENNLTV